MTDTTAAKAGAAIRAMILPLALAQFIASYAATNPGPAFLRVHHARTALAQCAAWSGQPILHRNAWCDTGRTIRRFPRGDANGALEPHCPDRLGAH
jgi:hypothetical protein